MYLQDYFEIEDGVLKTFTGPDAQVQVPEGVHTIGEGVFKGMSWILSVSLPSTIRKIGPSAFKGCRQLRKINFPEGLSEVGAYAFHRCHGIEELVFPTSMTEVGDHAFLYCDSLKKLVMEGPVKLGKAVLSHDILLREISINKNLDDGNFGDEVFEGCVNIKKITLSGETYEIENLIEAMDADSEYPGLIRSIAKGVYHSMQIEDGVLGKYSINLKSVFLPEGITAIGKSCFFDKKGIVNITFPESLREIRANAFLNCSSLEEITFLSETVSLDDRAFRGCSNLKRVKLPGGTYLLEVESEVELVNRIRDQVLGDFYISGRILMRYMGNEEQIRIPKGVEIIGERCFFGKEQLKLVCCPDSLREIKEQAFCGCVSLQNVVLSERVSRIEREAFAECKKLLKCNIPETVSFIGEYAFRRCFSLKLSAPLPGNADVHEYAFYLADRAVKTGAETDGRKSGTAVSAEAEEEKSGTAVSAETDGRKSGTDARSEEGENETLKEGALPGDVRSETGKDFETADPDFATVAPYFHAHEAGIRTLNLSGIKMIGKYAYASCPDLEEIIIDAPECVIERNAFTACPKLRKIRLVVKELGPGCFSYCRKLEEAVLSGVSVLPAESFAGCYMLSKFEAKEITQMDARCFDECVNLNSFDFSGIRVIGERAFERCDSLKRAELSDVSCGYHAFADCASLAEVEITKDTVLGSGVFTGCTQVKSVVYDSVRYEFSKFADGLNHVGNPYPVPVREVIASIYSCFEIEERSVITGYSQDGAEITVPEDVTEIGQDVFREHVRLRKINIPASVKIFGSHAFSQTAWLDEEREKSETLIVNNILVDGAGCKGRVMLSPKVKRVAAWCFAGNAEITELEIPSERIIIENLAFRNCLNLKKITDWNGREYVLENVSDLTEKEYPELVGRIFAECINCFKLDENKVLVESTGNIKELRFPGGITAVGDEVYKDCHLLEKIELSDDTKSIGKSAFENSKWLRSVTKAGNISFIGAKAFSCCQSLESIDLSDSLAELGSRCFEHCGSLKEINLSGSLGKIPERAFFRCKSLTKIVVPESVKVIEAEAFAFCDGLTEAYVPAGTEIKDRAFAYCEKLDLHIY